jgi:hypothetical protein
MVEVPFPQPGCVLLEVPKPRAVSLSLSFRFKSLSLFVCTAQPVSQPSRARKSAVGVTSVGYE